ncbi:hypothetical protein DFH08DRAFT_972626 [Mycena albidolilacea]|uniref:F-box domain-containing protein n=1 Tax=Mycena albidolilacea TaxID=1033008 RepID=A0AAD6ZBK5_9AGAR|nr:hypothetical protein DFH08DRAFT_972626 [Mycena albidolilacea]
MPGSNLTYLPPRASFEDLPVEMYGEVASHTPTLDLIQLSRTSRVLFDCLAGPSSRPFWKRRVSELKGLPPCPAGMGEYHYLALVLLRACQRCSTGKVGTIDWDFKLRLCQPCWRRVLTEMRDIIAIRPQTSHSPAVCVTADLVAIKYHLAKMTSGEQFEFIEQRKALMHACICRTWDKEFYAPIREQRIPLIRAKLEALGWRDELIMLGNDFNQYGLVSDPVELTDSEWESLRPALEAYLLMESAKRTAKRPHKMKERHDHVNRWSEVHTKKIFCVDCPKSTRRFAVEGLRRHKRAK